MSFSPTEGAFEGFRLTRSHPLGVLSWAAVILAVNILVTLVVGPIEAPLKELETVTAAAMPDVARMAALMGQIAPSVLLAMLLQTVAAAVVNASVLRSLLRPERQVKVRFGRDELRVVGLLLAFLGVSFLATMILAVAMGLLSPLTGGRIVALSFIVNIAVTVLLYVRFALAGPMTIAEHRFRFWPSWRATRGHAWALVGSIALAASLAGVVALLANFIFLALAGIAVIAGGGQFSDLIVMLKPDADLMRPLPLLYVAFLSVLYAIALAILNGPQVELYRALQRDGAMD